MTIYRVYKKNHPITPKDVLNVFDLGHLGVETDFPEQQYHPYQIESKGIRIYLWKKKKKKTIKVILERE